MGPLVHLITKRYLFSSHQRFVPLLTTTTFVGITLAVFFLVVVLSVMRGFQKELDQRWIGLNAHLTVFFKGAPTAEWSDVAVWPEVQEVEEFVSGEVILQTERGGETVSVAGKLKGVKTISQAFLAQAKLYPAWDKEWSLLGGDELFGTLGLHPDYPHPLKVITPFGEIGPTGDFVPRVKTFTPSHVFRTGLYIWDAYTVLVPLEEAVPLLGESAERGLMIRLKNIADIAKVEKRLESRLQAGTKMESFAKQNAKLLSALKLERIGMTFLLILFLLVASFSIASLLLMFLFAKQRDLAVLRAIGLTPEGARKLYHTLGLLLGGAGTLTGVLLAAGACSLLARYPIPLPSTYYLDTLPVQISFKIVFGGLAIGFLLAWISAWYPARLVSKMELLPLLREE